MPYPSRIHARYRLKASSDLTPARAEFLARFIAYEQTVELPEALIKDPYLLERIVGRVEELQAQADGSYEAQISFSAELASEQLGQLINLLYGNVSMLDGIRLLDVQLPPELLLRFSGPRHGSDGLRRLTGVYGRPLLATAVKPRGLSNEALAKIAGDFALGGGDIVKDDQNLVAEDFERFKLRVDEIAKAVERANEKTGRQCLYFPHLAARSEDIDQYLEFIYRRGLKGVLACPMVLGLDRARELTARHGLVYMAHPAMTGAFTSGRDHGIAHRVLLGTLFRLSGADISVFPASGGRFDYAPEDCAGIRHELQRPMSHIMPTLPCPAGGMRFDSIPQLAQNYGSDSVLLIGGSLLAHLPDLVAGTKAFLGKIAEHFQEERVPADTELASSCEFPADFASEHGEGIRKLLNFLPGFRWDGRLDRIYKAQTELGFEGVRRVELVGKNGEQTDFHLRYFEVSPGGYTSLEKHLHTHVIINVRGAGVLISEQQRTDIGLMDIAYIPPLEVHQLRNETTEPFGFFCIVDGERDRPMKP
jgi:ribulose-bisphosphate carboxylase large chain